MLVNLKNVILRFILHLIHHESFSFISNNTDSCKMIANNNQFSDENYTKETTNLNNNNEKM